MVSLERIILFELIFSLFRQFTAAAKHFEDLSDLERSNSIKLSSTINGDAVDFLLIHPAIRNYNHSSTLIYLKNNSSPSIETIKSFMVLPDFVSSSSHFQYRARIRLEEILNNSLYPCNRREDSRSLIISCDGDFLLLLSSSID